MKEQVLLRRGLGRLGVMVPFVSSCLAVEVVGLGDF